MKQSAQLLHRSRRYHRWLMAMVGLQFLIWSVSGVYMVFMDIDYIHGDTLIHNHQQQIDPQLMQYPLDNLLQRYPDAQGISVGLYLDKVVYRFSTEQRKWQLDASSGEPIAPVTQGQALQVARDYYRGSADVASAELLVNDAPFELNPYALPAWRVNFDHWSAPSLYISAETGLLVGTRHLFWRLFDWMFRFHVMDYDDGEDINNGLLFVAALIGIIAALCGVVLVYFRVLHSRRKPLKQLYNTAEAD